MSNNINLNFTKWNELLDSPADGQIIPPHRAVAGELHAQAMAAWSTAKGILETYKSDHVGNHAKWPDGSKFLPSEASEMLKMPADELGMMFIKASLSPEEKVEFGKLLKKLEKAKAAAQSPGRHCQPT